MSPLPRIVPSTPAVREDNGQSLSLRVYQDFDEVQKLEPVWNDLVSAYPLSSIFCTWEWVISWWQSFGHGRKLLVLALFDSSSQLLGLAPLSISTEPYLGSISARVVRFMGDGSEDSDNLDFPVRPGFERILASKILEYLRGHSSQWDISQFNTMPERSLVASCLAGSLRPLRWSCFEYQRNRLTISLPSIWDEYLDQISPKEKRNIGYYGRRLGKKYLVRIYRCTRESELAVCLEALFRLHQLRWQHAGQPGSFADEARRQFYADLGKRLLFRNRLELWIVELDGKIAAVQFAMRYGDTVYSLQEGYDPNHASDRIGFILRGEVLKQLISEGVRVYDFLAGVDEHKARWKPQAGFYRDLHFARAWSKGGVVLKSEHRMLFTKEWLRAHLQPSVWRLLHKANLALRQRIIPTSNKSSDEG